MLLCRNPTTLSFNSPALDFLTFHFYCSLCLFAGVGGVGRHVIAQLHLISKDYPNLRLCHISRSRNSLYAQDFEQPLPFDSWERDLAQAAQEPLSLNGLLKYLASAPGKSVVVDNTSSSDVAAAYPMFLKQGISVVTPNKKAFSGSLELWKDIFSSVRSSSNLTGGYVYHESSVGAGLPIISTLKDLVDTGDEVARIEGVFSGTMSFLFNTFAPVQGTGGVWSDEVRRAKAAGFTEPDPREDLNGLDVARKLVILARLSGLDIQNTSSFPVQSLIPKELESVESADEFMEGLPRFDGAMASMRDDANAQGKVVRFVGSIDVKKAVLNVGIQTFDKSHPIAALKGSDNIISFYTKRYGSNPLIVQGGG